MPLKKRADGRYVRAIKDERTGKRVYFYGYSEREINKKILDYTARTGQGRLFSEVANDWWETEVEKLSPSTVRGYRAATEHIIEYFGDMSVSEIETSDISKVLNKLARQGFARKTVKNHKIIINRIFHFAVIEGDIKYNPAIEAEIPRNLPETKRHPATPAEEATIRKNSDVWLLPYLALTTGMRKGELLGLRWEDIDLEKNLIYVRRSVWYGSGIHIKEPKTEAGKRKIPIIQPLREELLKHLGNPQHFVFGGESPISEKKFRCMYSKFQKETGVTATLQQLRKSFATIAVGANLQPDVLKSIFGHKNISTTLNIYAEVRDSRIAEAGEILSASEMGKK